MTSNSIPVLLVTANVGSIFEDPAQMLELWTKEFLATVTKLDPKFIALHCQEVGGKNYEESMRHVKLFLDLLMTSSELRLFDKIRVFLDEDYSSAENFTALGNLYFIHESMENVLLWDFKESAYVPVHGKEIYSGNIESVTTKEKAKFPQNYFPECKWSRKGFMRTRWSLQGSIFDLINIHLFHDASNFVAMETCPSIYCQTRRKALEHTLHRFHNDTYGKAPYFLFGDFNFRTDTEGVVNKLTEGLNKVQISKNEIQYTNDNKSILTLGKKEFNHFDHQTVFYKSNPTWLKSYDKELDAFKEHLSEYPVTFPPSYPFEEKISQGTCYMQTRCPAWCDRVLLSHTAKQLIDEQRSDVAYNVIGAETCMGDHKPVYLRADLRVNAGTVLCCQHAPFVCLPSVCTCCHSYALKINVIDTDIDSAIKKSYTEIFIDNKLLREPITRDMLCHEPYTPESVDSHSPMPEKIEIDSDDPPKKFVSPTQLKHRLEKVIMEELNRSPRMMKRSASENVDISVNNTGFRTRTMSEVPTKTQRHISLASRGSLHRLQSHHSSSSETWYESDHDEDINDYQQVNKQVNFCFDDDPTIQKDCKAKVKRKSKSNCCLLS